MKFCTLEVRALQRAPMRAAVVGVTLDQGSRQLCPCQVYPSVVRAAAAGVDGDPGFVVERAVAPGVLILGEDRRSEGEPAVG
jgi:hypothetical protein